MALLEPTETYEPGNLIYKEEAYTVISCCMEVHKSLGRGFLEIVYKDALMKEFRNRNIQFTREKKFQVFYKGEPLEHYFTADFIVYDKIVLEIKAQQDIIDPHYKQVLNYLAVTKMKLGLVVNFGEESLKFKRIVL